MYKSMSGQFERRLVEYAGKRKHAAGTFWHYELDVKALFWIFTSSFKNGSGGNGRKNMIYIRFLCGFGAFEGILGFETGRD